MWATVMKSIPQLKKTVDQLLRFCAEMFNLVKEGKQLYISCITRDEAYNSICPEAQSCT